MGTVEMGSVSPQHWLHQALWPVSGLQLHQKSSSALVVEFGLQSLASISPRSQEYPHYVLQQQGEFRPNENRFFFLLGIFGGVNSPL